MSSGTLRLDSTSEEDDLEDFDDEELQARVLAPAYNRRMDENLFC
jgi:hypothetical protein